MGWRKQRYDSGVWDVCGTQGHHMLHLVVLEGWHEDWGMAIQGLTGFLQSQQLSVLLQVGKCCGLTIVPAQTVNLSWSSR
jgi:hypothetical protein